jgi:N-methylhydantoinase B
VSSDAQVAPAEGFGGIDPITAEVVRGYLNAMLEKMLWRVIRSGLSPNITERLDVSTAIIDPDGNTVAQLEAAPIHLAELAGAGNHLFENYPISEIRPGDVFMVNDCYSGGGTHLPDVTVMMPVFYHGQLIAIVANLAHHLDIGGGRGAGRATIYDEGLRIPVLRIVEQGRVREDVLRFILLNCRLADQRRGDLAAQIAANELAAAELIELCDRYDPETILATYAALHEYGKRKLHAAIRGLADGIYTFVDYMDDDGAGTKMLPICVTLEISDGAIHIDFEGTGPQTAGNVNLVRHGTEGCVLFVLRAALDPTIPPTADFVDDVRLSIPERSVVNPTPPAGCRARTDTAQRVVGVLLGAFAQAMPGRLPAGGCDSTQAMNLSGDDDDGVYYSISETFGGGGGARPSKDGMDAVHINMVNVANFPLEVAEAEYPMRYRRHVLRTDSGGAGRFRGGLGEIREFELVSDSARIGLHGDRHETVPAGAAGGLDGVSGESWLNLGRPEAEKIPSKEIGHVVARGDVFSLLTPGGGGYGDPHEREARSVLQDVANGRVSVDAARELYGVIVREDEEGDYVLEEAKTLAQRERA